MSDDLIRELRISIRVNRTYKKDFIYLIGADDSALAKGNNKKSSKNEYKWGVYLYENYVQVPEMYSLIKPDSIISRIKHIGSEIKEWFVIMERLKGLDIIDTSGAARQEAVRQYRKELEKVLELGICPRDSSWGGNAIFGEDDKLYLIDFESWEKGSKNELNIFYERIKNPNIKFRYDSSW